MIGARRYIEEHDYEMLCQWWIDHDEVPPIACLYPETGFIVENVAAAFLYKTDSCMALIEMIIYNPRSPKEIRQKALDDVIEAVILEAKGQDFEVLAGFTDLPVVVERSKKFNFNNEEKQYTMITRELDYGIREENS